MKAGRYMDSRVAIEVMGLSVRPIRTICSRGMIDDIGTVSAPYKMRDGREGVSAKPIPHYSSDNGAACEVMGRMVDLGHVWLGMSWCSILPRAFITSKPSAATCAPG